MGVVGSCDTGLGVVGLALKGDAPSLPPGVGVFGTGYNVGVQGLGGSNGGKECLAKAEAEPLKA